MNDAALHRRIRFLLSEAVVDPPLYDQCITMTLRVVSSVVACGHDVGSQRFKELTRYMSRNAHELKASLDNKREFASRTINEHPDELKDVWNWMTSKRGRLSVEEVLDRFRRWPMVVVTKEEDNDMRPLRGKGPEARYARIEVLELKDGKWEPRR